MLAANTGEARDVLYTLLMTQADPRPRQRWTPYPYLRGVTRESSQRAEHSEINAVYQKTTQKFLQN